MTAREQRGLGNRGICMAVFLEPKIKSLIIIIFERKLDSGAWHLHPCLLSVLSLTATKGDKGRGRGLQKDN